MKSPDHDAETGFSLALKRATSGEEHVIVETGSSTAKAVLLSDQPKRMVLGPAAGEFTVPGDFNDPLPKEIEDLFW